MSKAYDPTTGGTKHSNRSEVFAEGNDFSGAYIVSEGASVPTEPDGVLPGTNKPDPAKLLRRMHERHGTTPVSNSVSVAHPVPTDISYPGCGYNKSDPREVFLAMAKKHNVPGVTGVKREEPVPRDFYPGLDEMDEVMVNVEGKRVKMNVAAARAYHIENWAEAQRTKMLLNDRKQAIQSKQQQDKETYIDSRSSAQRNEVLKALGVSQKDWEVLKEIAIQEQINAAIIQESTTEE